MDDDDTLPEVRTPLVEGAVELHEMFSSWVEAGFTEWQACQVLGVFLAENGRQR
jgi:hypothetical protein